MAHIPDGVLSVPVLVGGGLIAAAGLALALRRLDELTIPRTAIFSAGFFVVSLVVIPIGPTSVHLLLAGLMGIVIGVLTIPAVLVALLLQSALFGFGGLTAIGVNTVNIALPGVILGAVAARFMACADPVRAGIAAAACAAGVVALTGGGVALALALSSPDYVLSARVVAIAYIPLMAAEALITGFAVIFLKRVKPEMLVHRQALEAREV